MTAVTVEIREPILGLTVFTHELTAEEIVSGEYNIPTVDSGDIFMEHMDEYNAAEKFPEELQLYVAVRYESAEGEQILEYNVKDSPEQGWSVRYWADDEPAEEGVYPGHFRFSTYESLVPVSVVINEPEKVMTMPWKTVLSVTLSIDGREIPPEDCQIIEEEMEDPFAEYLEPGVEPQNYFYARILVKRPEWASEHGILHIKVVQQLAEDGSLWTTERDLEY